MSKPTIEQTRMGAEGIAFCIARTLIERDPSLKAPLRANLRKMWELLEEREDHGAAAAMLAGATLCMIAMEERPLAGPGAPEMAE